MGLFGDLGDIVGSLKEVTDELTSAKDEVLGSVNDAVSEFGTAAEETKASVEDAIDSAKQSINGE